MPSFTVNSLMLIIIIGIVKYSSILNMFENLALNKNSLKLIIKFFIFGMRCISYVFCHKGKPCKSICIRIFQNIILFVLFFIFSIFYICVTLYSLNSFLMNLYTSQFYLAINKSGCRNMELIFVWFLAYSKSYAQYLIQVLLISVTSCVNVFF